ncbi:MAG: hypothetical protein WAL75_25125, partial [Terracidiphilus sp.]
CSRQKNTASNLSQSHKTRCGPWEAAEKPIQRGNFASDDSAGAKALAHFGRLIGTTKVVPCYKTYPN